MVPPGMFRYERSGRAAGGERFCVPFLPVVMLIEAAGADCGFNGRIGIGQK